jgi:hypothetical protein
MGVKLGSLTLREEHTLKIERWGECLNLRQEEETRRWRKMHSEELHHHLSLHPLLLPPPPQSLLLLSCIFCAVSAIGHSAVDSAHQNKNMN